MIVASTFAETWTQIWTWIAWGNTQLRDVLAYATFFAVMYQVVTFWRSRRLVAVAVVNRDAPALERMEISKVPASFASRAEIMGLVAQAAGGERLDFSRFAFDYKFRRQIVGELPEESYRKVATRTKE